MGQFDDETQITPTGEGTVQTFNFDGDHHLSGQNQNICVRREVGNCR